MHTYLNTSIFARFISSFSFMLAPRGAARIVSTHLCASPVEEEN